LGKSGFRTNNGILYPLVAAVKTNNAGKTFLQEDSDGYVLPGYQAGLPFGQGFWRFLPPHARYQEQHNRKHYANQN
jgi:hypothetical protein